MPLPFRQVRIQRLIVLLQPLVQRRQYILEPEFIAAALLGLLDTLGNNGSHLFAGNAVDQLRFEPGVDIAGHLTGGRLNWQRGFQRDRLATLSFTYPPGTCNERSA